MANNVEIQTKLFSNKNFFVEIFSIIGLIIVNIIGFNEIKDLDLTTKNNYDLFLAGYFTCTLTLYSITILAFIFFVLVKLFRFISLIVTELILLIILAIDMICIIPFFPFVLTGTQLFRLTFYIVFNVMMSMICMGLLIVIIFHLILSGLLNLNKKLIEIQDKIKEKTQICNDNQDIQKVTININPQE
ncbi:Hypothetical protein KVN_LOCUS31 [uncultured virus]|nr:Hypothetical protein KVN_LOCUS31 [uncultured virus]